MLVLAGLAGGCGSGSGSGSATTRIAGANPGGGFTSLHGQGFAIAVPAGWFSTSAGPSGNGPMVTVMIPHGSSAARIEVQYFAHPAAIGESVGQLVRDNQRSNATAGSLFHITSRQASSARVPGARQAKLIIQRGTDRAGPQRSQELIVESQSGALITVTAYSFQANSNFDPGQVIQSFRLTAAV